MSTARAAATVRCSSGRGQSARYAAGDEPGIPVLIVDDNRLYREALARTLAAERWITAAEIAPESEVDLLHRVEFPPTVTLLNLSMAGSFELLTALSNARARVVVFGVREVESEIVRCAEAGAAGYLLRGDSFSALRDVILAAAHGEAICSPKTAGALLRRVAVLAAEHRHRDGLGALTARESEILDLLERGMANREIARELGIQLRTVKNHVHAILGKLGVERRGQAAARARAARRTFAV